MKNDTTPIVWLKVTDFMHGWLQWELGGRIMVKDCRVICATHLPQVREVMRMEADEMAQQRPVEYTMSAAWKNCMDAGLDIDEQAMEREYGMSREIMKTFLPIECPKMCMTSNGVLRPWTVSVSLSKQQAKALRQVLREEFWKAVEAYDHNYAAQMDGEPYHAIDMVEDFCIDTETPDIYVEAIRREWQRRVKRNT